MTEPEAPHTPVTLSPEEAEKAQKRRNVWLGLALCGLALLVGLISALRLVENVARTAG